MPEYEIKMFLKMRTFTFPFMLQTKMLLTRTYLVQYLDRNIDNYLHRNKNRL